MNKVIWTSYHIKDIPLRYNLRESNIIKLFCTSNLSLKEDNINYLNKYLGELCTMYYVWKNQIKSDYVGFQHYRMLLRNIETTKDILVDNGWNDSIISYYNNGGLQTHIIYESINYLSNKLNKSQSELLDLMLSNIICFDGNVFMCKWNIFNDLCETIFGFLDYLFPNNSWKNENILYSYITNLHKLFINNKNIIRDHWYYAQYSYNWDPRYIIYFMEYFIPFYLNIKYNKYLNNTKYFNTDNIDNNNTILNFQNKVIVCDFQNENISIDKFTKWYELNNCSGIKYYYIVNYSNSDIYKKYLENDGLFYGKYKYVKFIDNDKLNLDNSLIYNISIDDYIDTISYEFHVYNKYNIKHI